MPVVIVSNTFADEFNTGTTSTPLGNAGDELINEVTFYFENIVDASTDATNKLQFDDAANFVGTSPAYSGKFAIECQGFTNSNEINGNIQIAEEFIGKEVTVAGVSPGSYNVTAEVLEVVVSFGSPAIIVLDTATVGSTSSNNGNFYISNDITSFEFDYSYDRGNFNDYTGQISDTLNQTFYSSNTVVLDASNVTPINLDYKTNGSYQAGTMTIEGVSKTAQRKEFKIVHTHNIVPISQGVYDFSFVYKFQLKPKRDFASIPSNASITNPFFVESGKYQVFADRIGNINTNLGITNTQYSYSNFSIVRTSDSEVANVPLVQEQFTVSFDVDNAAAPFSDGNTLLKVYIENIPDVLTSSTQNYEQKFIWDRAITTCDSVPTPISGESTGDAASITNYEVLYVSSSKVTVSFDCLFTANAQTQINANGSPNFSIGIAVQDHTLNYVTTDRITLEVFNGTGVQKILADPIQVENTTFITAPFNTVFEGIDETEIDGFPTQLMVAASRFYADWTGRPNLRIETVTQKLVLKNSSTLQEIELENTAIPVNSFPLINSEYPSASYIVDKGYKIPTSEVRNKIQMFNDGDVGNEHYFQVLFPFFVRWEYYKALVLNNVPSDLIDTAEPNNGLNYFVHRIDTVANWSFNYRLTFDSIEDGVPFSQDFDYEIPTNDYETHPDVLDRRIKSYSEDTLTELVDAGTKFIESTENTYFIVEWEMSVAPTAITDFEIEVYIEGYENGSPTSIQRISSVNDLLNSSWFTDTGSGNGRIEKTINGSWAQGKFYIDKDKLSIFDNYRVYPSIYLPKLPDVYLTTEDSLGYTSESGYLLKEE